MHLKNVLRRFLEKNQVSWLRLFLNLKPCTGPSQSNSNKSSKRPTACFRLLGVDAKKHTNLLSRSAQVPAHLWGNKGLSQYISLSVHADLRCLQGINR